MIDKMILDKRHIACMVAFLMVQTCVLGEAQTREVRSWDASWKFLKGDVQNAENPAFNDADWRTVDLPHDWSIEGPFMEKGGGGTSGGFLPLGIGWYRKQFDLPATGKGKKVFVQFDGIYKDSDVWLNGQHLGKRYNGYVSFEYDLTPHINWGGSNVLAVRVDNEKAGCRWYSGSGIYRHVWLTLTDPLHVGHWGATVTTPNVSAQEATVRVKTLVRNEYTEVRPCTLTTKILDPAGKVVATAEVSQAIPSGGTNEFSQDLTIPRPARWSVESPSLYTAVTAVTTGERIVDTYSTPFGIRDVIWDPDRGLLINGQSVKLKGVCIHHDLGALGAAFNEKAMERRLKVLKGIGCNAIRTAHNPPAPQLLDLCDRMGFLVIDEAFDKWGPGNSVWAKNWQMDLGSMLRRDRNHPSVILWSVGNEVGEQQSEEGSKKLKMLTEFVHKEEPSRKVTCAASPSFSPAFVNATDIASLNYQEQWFEKYRKDNPKIIMLGSECYIYYRGKDDNKKAFYPFNPWLDTVKNDYAVGTFYWTGIDYLGEARAGWPFHGWNCSLIDTCGFPRPISNLQRSFWTDEPMVHIAVLHDRLDVQRPVKSHWDWPKMVSHWTLPSLEGQEVKIVTFTNCKSVELFVDGKSVGTKKLSDFEDKMIAWTVPCRAGTIKAVGLNDEKAVCSHELKTAGKPVGMVLSPDSAVLKADGRDVCHVEISIVDASGTLVPSAMHPLQFAIQGPGKIIGVDNGDLTSKESYQGMSRKAFNGRCLVIIQSTGKPGQIALTASSAGLSEGKVSIQAE
jgi:beta-galactosidase